MSCRYGIFRQHIAENGEQVELPDPWLDHGNPWDIARPDNAVEVRFYGQATRFTEGDGQGEWTGGITVLAVPHDMPIPGFKTENVSTLRLWAARPKRPFDLSSFNAGQYDNAVAELNDATLITRVLYPNDNNEEGKTLRLKQEYFWVAASLHDIIRRFKKMDKPWTEFSNMNAIQLNDTHPTLSIPELRTYKLFQSVICSSSTSERILVDEEGLGFSKGALFETICEAYS